MHDDASPGPPRKRRVFTHDEAVLYLSDLADLLPEYAEWLLNIARRLESQAISARSTPAAEARDPQSSRGVTDQRCRQPDVRRFRRWPVALMGRFDGPQGSAKALISELGAGGLKTATGISCQAGDRVTVSWCLAGENDPFCVTGVVRYDVPDGVGVEFIDLSDADRIRIERYFQQRRFAASAGGK